MVEGKREIVGVRREGGRHGGGKESKVEKEGEREGGVREE